MKNINVSGKNNTGWIKKKFIPKQSSTMIKK